VLWYHYFKNRQKIALVETRAVMDLKSPVLKKKIQDHLFIILYSFAYAKALFFHYLLLFAG
jgi:hypothetical protein